MKKSTNQQHINEWVGSNEKRRLDLAILVAVAPIIAHFGVLAVLVSLPAFKQHVFFEHHRVGKDGRTFPVRKIRTMRMDSPTDTPRSGFKDERATRLGKLLRFTSIDEIPQLLSIAKGDMSFTGPRVVMANDIEAMKTALSRNLFDEWQDVYFRSVPGGYSSSTISDRVNPICDSPEERLIRRAHLDIRDYSSSSPSYDLRLLITGLSVARIPLINLSHHVPDSLKAGL